MKLKELVKRKICYGIVQPGSGNHEGVPVIKAGNIVNGLNRLADLELATEASARKYPRSTLNGGELVISLVGSVGKVAVVPASFIGANLVRATGLIDIDDHTLKYWVKYYIESPEGQAYIRSNLNTTVQPTLNIKSLEEMDIPIIEEETMERIVSILKSIENKVVSNALINENLLQQAGAVFDKFYKESTNQQPFTSLINVLGGGTPKTGNPDFWDGPIPFFTPKDVGTPYTFQTEKHITESGLAHCNSRLYRKDTTFVTARGTVGKVSLAGTPMAMNQSCYALASDVTDPLLVYFYVLKAVSSLKYKASGAVFDAIVTRDFDSETINILSDDDSKSVLSIIRPMMEAIHNNSKETMRLASLRDSLLPQLMSGELDVSDLDL